MYKCVCDPKHLQLGFARTDCSIHFLNPVTHENEETYVRLLYHEPVRDDNVAKWIKRWRNQYPEGSNAWHYIDDMLDDYRLHADVGQPLHIVVHRRKPRR